MPGIVGQVILLRGLHRRVAVFTRHLIIGHAALRIAQSRRKLQLGMLAVLRHLAGALADFAAIAQAGGIINAFILACFILGHAAACLSLRTVGLGVPRILIGAALACAGTRALSLAIAAALTCALTFAAAVALGAALSGGRLRRAADSRLGAL